MEFEFLVNRGEKVHVIEVGKNEDVLHILLNKEQRVEAGYRVLSNNVYSIFMGNRSITAYCAETDDGVIHIYTGDKEYELHRPREANARKGFETGDESLSDIEAPMPGNVVKLLVNPGDIVKKGMNLIIIESMKMENSIRAPIDGKVVKINVKEGELATPGMPLIELEKIAQNDLTGKQV